jgi:hypothetical protein
MPVSAFARVAHWRGDGIRASTPTGSTRKHLHTLMHMLEGNKPGAQTRLSAALRRAFPLLRQRGSVMIISDFFDQSAEIFAALNLYLHRGFKIYLFHVLTPEELDLPDKGLLSFRDLETAQRLVAHTSLIRKEYQKAIQEHIRALRELSARRQVRYFFARTDTHYYTLFDQFMA